MLRLHPRILKREGKRAFAVLPYEEFLRVREELEDYDDLKALHAAKAKEGHARTMPLSKVRARLGV